MENDVLVKFKNNIMQSKLSQMDRIENVKNVYKIKNINKIENKRVLLIDDIFTTGATVNECCKILSLAGTKNVDIFTVAKD